MALYLGNQKVSLRSGQDPTFDYGFDSNGRLVFANKNATEINNFLNYDSTYSEILDLSNLSKMEKVAVNGTADRKMEGLKGLLVSPNAPFTGSSPQINASYTGLSKSALVSLFESAPYNVGYEKVGNPTIVDGVASGFSNSDYLKFVNKLNINSCKLELFTSFTTGNDVYEGYHIIGPAAYNCSYGVYIYRNYIRTSIAYYDTNRTLKYNEISFHCEPNKKYYVKREMDLTNKTFISKFSTDGVNYTSRSSAIDDFSSWGIVSVYFQIGKGGKFGPFNGFIDLNETYIKVNGVPWFTGKPAMTKTCSIVGATGTADLTQEDKNIILNKGWSLTVQ